MGLWIRDNGNLEEVAHTCRQRNRSARLVTIPLARLQKAAGNL